MSDTQPEQKVCPTCSGQGKIIFNRSREGKPNTRESCSTCNGTGKVAKEEQWCQDHENCDYRPKSDKQPEEKICPTCEGEGYKYEEAVGWKCPTCNGTGKVAIEHYITDEYSLDSLDGTQFVYLCSCGHKSFGYKKSNEHMLAHMVEPQSIPMSHDVSPTTDIANKQPIPQDTEKDFGNPKGQTFEEVARHWFQGVKDNGCSVTVATTWVTAKYHADKQAAEKKAWAEGYHKGAEFSQQAAVRAVLEGLKEGHFHHERGATFVYVSQIDEAIAAIDQPTGGEK